MTDLRPFEAYQRSLSGVERRLIAETRRSLRAFRIDMLDALDRFGLSPSFTVSMESGFVQLRMDASRAARVEIPEIAKTAQIYTEKQVRSLGIDIPTPGDGAAVAALLAAAWVDILRGRMVAEIARIRASGDLANAPARLLATQLQDGKASAWRHGRNAMQSELVGGIWNAANGVADVIYTTLQQDTGRKFKKQAVAAIDERTTDCCLRVHGQIQPLKTRFHLTGTPRFADRIMNPPFHWYCRTATSLYLPEFDEMGVSTADMRGAAAAEINARARTGRRVEIHPAHATSTRSQ